MTANTMDEKAAQQINFQGDGDDWESASQDFKDHFIAAFEHKAGLGPHPGKRRKSHHRIREGDEQEERETPTEADMQRVREEYHDEFEEQLSSKMSDPTPPAESLPRHSSKGWRR